MTIVIVNQGEEDMIDALAAVNYTVHLFTNDAAAGLTQSQIDALDESDFTEATFTGYSAKALTGGSWTTTPGNPAAASYSTQNFPRTATGAPETVYGYYVTRTSGGRLQWFEYLNNPVGIEFDGEYIQVTPRFTLRDEED
ncbi:hypothetical protein [Herbidospora daliensis]|uniref:hypothetical protein n=1 Tax=Herbidospora daliensis TaxID=295585 RepID=UPI000782300C|nr:hypothetical protein [Herbidospora daliensis]